MTAPRRFADLAPSRWPNGAGRKADLAAGDGWLASFAWLDADAPFSDYTGHDRTITLIDGAGFTLSFAGHPDLAVKTRFTPTPFDGGWPATCRLADGPCVVVNAMTRRAAWRHAVEIHHGPLTLPPATGPRFLVMLSGTGRLDGGHPATPRDAWEILPQGADLAGPDGLCTALFRFTAVA